MKYQIFEKPPADFKHTVEAAGCYCEFEDRILFLKRHQDKPQGATWGVPGGKLEKGETPREAVIREVFEEVGIPISDDEDLKEMSSLYIRLPHMDYVYHRFYKKFATLPQLDIALDEHDEAAWVTYEEALQLPLISGGKEALTGFMDFKKSRTKF